MPGDLLDVFALDPARAQRVDAWIARATLTHHDAVCAVERQAAAQLAARLGVPLEERA